MTQYGKTLTVYGAGAGVLGLVFSGLWLAGLSVRDSLIYLVPLAVVAVGIGAAVDLFGLFAWVMASLPFATASDFEIGGITFNVYTLGVIGFFLLGLIRSGLGYGGIIVRWSDLALVAFCLLYLWTTLNSPFLVRSGYLSFHAIFIPVLAYYALRLWVNHPGAYFGLKKLFCLSVAVYAVIMVGVYLHTRQRVEFLLPAISASNIALAAGFFAYYGSLFSKTLRWILALLIALGLVVTFGRMALVLALISPGLYFLFRRGLGFWLLFATLASTLLLTVLLAQNYQLFRPSSNYDASRWTTWERVTDVDSWKLSLYGRGADFAESLEEFAEHPIVGNGLRPGLFITRHNLHLEWLEYGGLLGYSLMMGFLLRHFWRFQPLARRSPEVAANLLAAFAVVGNALFNGVMHGVAPNVLFLCLALNECYAALLVRQQSTVQVLKANRAKAALA